MSKKNEVELREEKKISFRKSNFFIDSKQKTTLLENKIFNIALANTQRIEENNGELISRIKASELKKMIGSNSGTFYEKLFAVGDGLTGKKIGVSDPVNKYFDYIVIIIRATYQNGIFTIKWSPDIKEYLLDIKDKFTPLQLPMILSFKSNYSFLLYEKLRSRAYTRKYQHVQQELYHETFSLAELKFDLGVVNAEEDKVKAILSKRTNPDFNKALSVASDKMFDEWGNFKKKVLDVAKKEINEKTDVEIDYVPIRGGLGGKVYQVEFLVRYKPVSIVEETVCEKKLELSEHEKILFLEKIAMLIKQTLSINDLYAIANAADYDYDKVSKAYDCLKGQKSPVNNTVGFLITAIKSNYEKKYVQATNEFCQMIKQDYDFEEIERELLAN